jgi:hypothetical protein
MIAPADEVRNGSSRYEQETISDQHYRSPSCLANEPDQHIEKFKKTTEFINALAKQRPLAIVVAGFAAGLVVGIIAKRSS